MPERETIARARQDAREGKSPSTQAGEFVREEIHHVREGKHGVRSPKQAIAIGLSKARRAGVKLAPPQKGRASAKTRQQASSDTRAGNTGGRKKTSARRSQGATRVLKREGRSGASRTELSKQARTAARGRSSSNRRSASVKAARTKGAGRRQVARGRSAQTRLPRAA